MVLTEEVKKIRSQLDKYAGRELRMFASSSFQTHSIPLLHIIAQASHDIPVYFLNTGFHFPETIQFKNAIASRLQINLRSIESEIPKIAQRDSDGNFLYTSDPDRCCYFNKVMPLEPVLKSHDVWISGVRSDQTKFRQELKTEDTGAFDTIRYHPMLNWTAKMIWEYRNRFDLPEHPLEAAGYLSVGCVPCTRRFLEKGGDRTARWTGMTKEECGIHTEFSI